MLKRFASAWNFLTVIPLPVGDGGEGESLGDSAALFPAVGLGLGLLASIAGLLADMFFPPMATAALAVALLAAFSGGIHLDGVADSADGLLSALHSREKTLDIMRDSRIGAHGAMALVLLLLIKFACLAQIPAGEAPWVLLVVPVAGRAAMLFPMALLPYARKSGLGAIFSTENTQALLASACLWTGGSMFVFLGLRGLLYGMPLWLLLALAWTVFLKRRLGGATGDTYGAACELGETAVCMLAAVLFGEGG